MLPIDFMSLFSIIAAGNYQPVTYLEHSAGPFNKKHFEFITFKHLAQQLL